MTQQMVCEDFTMVINEVVDIVAHDDFMMKAVVIQDDCDFSCNLTHPGHPSSI